MNEADIKVKKQIIDKIKSSTNILIAVSENPSVDDLAAAIGFAALLNKLDKHATAIFSGDVPAALNFLDPEKVFENSVDSLRDFIISLDKEKADHLRYKVEGDVVKIFITPYRTTITGDDLEFSQGDYNVELVLALGVSNQEHLDKALSAHGQIIHDATVATLTVGNQTSQLGTLDWHDVEASSLCEMVASLNDLLKSDKTLLDKQISTALLTGIVAATDRFSNTRTSSRVMTVAAQLMAAGADQQLIAAKLQESHEINSLPPESQNELVERDNPTGSIMSSDDVSTSTLPPDKDGSLSIEHEAVVLEPEVNAVQLEDSSNLSTLSDSTLPPDLAQTIPAPQVDSTLVQPDSSNLASAYALEEEPPKPHDTIAIGHEPTIEPLLGGTLNATTDMAAEEAKKELDDQQNKMILNHAYLNGMPTAAPVDPNPINGIGQAEDLKNVDIFAAGPVAQDAPMSTIPDFPPPPPAPDFSTLPPPPLPDFGTIPTPSDVNLETVTAPNSNDPSQFRIPGQ